MDLGVPPLKIQILLGSNPVKSGFVVRGLTLPTEVSQSFWVLLQKDFVYC